jgi:hypothetical protein
MLLEIFAFLNFLLKNNKSIHTYYNETILDLARNFGTLHSYNLLTLGIKCDNSNYKIHTKYSRKIFATKIRNNGIEQEIRDLLQGCIPKSVFVRHYSRSVLQRFDKIK